MKHVPLEIYRLHFQKGKLLMNEKLASIIATVNKVWADLRLSGMMTSRVGGELSLKFHQFKRMMGSFLSRPEQKSGTMTDKPMNAHVRQVTDSIWTFSKPFLRVNLFKIGGRATAVRFPNGDVFLVSPVEPDDSTKETLDKIGKVKYLVAPDYEVWAPVCSR